MKRISVTLEKTSEIKRPRNISTEFQLFGVYLAEELSDTKHYSLYIKLAKSLPRQLLNDALSYVKDYPNAKSKGRLFMWKVKQLRELVKT
jgi:hypothetical protein